VLDLFDTLTAWLPLADFATPGMPPQRSTVAPMIDSHLAFINIVCYVFGALILAVLVWVIIAFTKPPGEKAESDVSHNTPLEITWSVIPLILVIVMFCIGLVGYNRLIALPADAYPITVRASQWQFEFDYPEGFTVSSDPGAFNADFSDRLASDADQGFHLPPNVPIRLTMMSNDVLHAFYIPEFRVKQDIVPGKLSFLWFEPVPPAGPEPDEYWLMCAEYCGTDHSKMYSKVYVHPTQESFDAWKIRATSWKETQTPVDRGKVLYKRKGCAQCHSIDGNANTGPTWLGLWGKGADEHFVRRDPKGTPEGLAVQGAAGEEYLFQSIRTPNALFAVGGNVAQGMSSILLKDEEILWIIEYIKSIGKDAAPK
jgi:cytochrome c oxidase subunit 2